MSPVMSNGKRIVYILRNEASPPRYYMGLTSNLRARLDAHNAGRCGHTASARPWHVDVVVKFAMRLERWRLSAI